MTFRISRHARLGLAAAAIAIAAGALGYTVAPRHDSEAGTSAEADAGRKVLYWYDPMVPLEHYDNPDTLSSMGMKTIPKYADEAATESGVRIDPALAQNLGMSTTETRMGALETGLTVSGTIGYDERQLALVQARAGGFVQRTYGLAPDDVIGVGAPLADLLIPEWAGAQQESLAVLQSGDAPLIAAARQRLVLLGMPQSTIAAVERDRRQRTVLTITTPVGGAIKSLGVLPGMSVAAGQTLAEVNGLAKVWLDAAVPEAMAGKLKPGTSVSAAMAAFPGETFAGRVRAILPDANTDSRTLTARIELPNPGGRLRPGMFASVNLAGEARQALLVPSEAVIRTGTRTLVMLALASGRYLPAEVRTGGEAGGHTEILAGLAPGEKVVVSGQFLIDSEASLAEVKVRPLGKAGQ